MADQFAVARAFLHLHELRITHVDAPRVGRDPRLLGKTSRYICRVATRRLGQISLGAARGGDTVEARALCVIAPEHSRCANRSQDISVPPRHRTLNGHETLAEVINRLGVGLQAEGAGEREGRAEDGHPTVPVQDPRGVAGGAHHLPDPSSTEFARTLTCTAGGGEVAALGGVEADLAEGSVRDHERSVSERHHPDDFTELVVRTAAANGQIQDRLWIDTPEARIAPKRPQRFHNRDARAVPALDQGGVITLDGAADGTGCRASCNDRQQDSSWPRCWCFGHLGALSEDISVAGRIPPSP